MRDRSQSAPGRYEFHIARTARDRYQFDDALFSLSGKVILANFHAARLLAQRINRRRDLLNFPEQAVRAGQINALGLIDEILHHVVDLYREQVNPLLIAEALAWLEHRLGREAVDRALLRFTEEFPPTAVYRRAIAPADYLAGETEGRPNRHIALEELLMLWLANANPATAPFRELFDDDELVRSSSYREIVAGLRAFTAEQPPFGPDHQPLVDMLRSPALAVPHSLSGQLTYILDRWGYLLGSRFFYRLLGSLDLIKEEERLAFTGPGPALVIDFKALRRAEEEAGAYARYSPDRDWMPRLVLMAKNAYVWLDQLSRKYGRELTRLDQIPDEELDTLARRGFTGLWLIGVWERSPASQRIKQLSGNPAPVGSAYSIAEYEIAADLGGPAACDELQRRAWQRGIRLASDMVPNHMGIDSRWVVEHPDRFIWLPYSPFPSYTFNGPDLSRDPRAGIFLEDHYYDRSDAAVVFKRVDRATGEERYIYHGNDGTLMPWNDTAQLNYLNPETREAVIQTILQVARRFPVIRFDAAMTLTKRHYQRLWFPEPGTGGAIPSRAEHGMTRAEFDAAMPQEFWREVVDRVAAEAPDTLLLAEAFWLLEGYFVRTLGMHRVYNSAFMNMLRDEQNAKYRAVIKNTIEFDPEILKRYVNFMNNPDERTAVDQFGKGDKYFGICTMMATMPGLPMFGHGQIEGFAERYGMEYKRASWQEEPDQELIARHEREIFPLLRRRRLFAGVEHFLLYDLVTPEGEVNEDVFAYSNGDEQERVLVVYHNRYASARGWIRQSAPYAVKGEGEEDRTLVRRTLAEGLGLHDDPNRFCLFRDQVSGLEYIRSSKVICDEGFYVELGAYKYHVFTDIREVEDVEGHPYAQLTAYLNGRGVPSIEQALRELMLQPVQAALAAIYNGALVARLVEARPAEPAAPLDAALLDEVEGRLRQLLVEARRIAGGAGDEAALARAMRRELEVLLRLPGLDEASPLPEQPAWREAEAWLRTRLGDRATWGIAFAWLVVHHLGRVVAEEGAGERARSWLDEWRLGNVVAGGLQDLGLDEGAARYRTALVKLLVSQEPWLPGEAGAARSPRQILEAWLQDEVARGLLQVNRYEGILWFNQEAFEELLWWCWLTQLVRVLADPRRAPEDTVAAVARLHAVAQRLRRAEQASRYQVDLLLAAAAEQSTAPVGAGPGSLPRPPAS